jgi:hypothetical protein
LRASVATQPHSRFDLLTFLLGEDDLTPTPIAILAGGLLIAIAIIHLQDQGGLLGEQSPTWLKWGYYVVELTSMLAALLVARKKPAGWVLALGASAFPFVGYVLSRTVGIPGDSGDIGNWGYTLGQVSLGVEAAVFLIASVSLYRIALAQRAHSAHRVEVREPVRVRTYESQISMTGSETLPGSQYGTAKT